MILLKTSKLSQTNYQQILDGFCMNQSAQQIAAKSGLNRHTVNKYLELLRNQIYKYQRDKALKEIEKPKIFITYFGKRKSNTEEVRKYQNEIPLMAILHYPDRFHSFPLKPKPVPELGALVELLEKGMSYPLIFADDLPIIKFLLPIFKEQYILLRLGRGKYRYYLNNDRLSVISNYWENFRDSVKVHNGISPTKYELYLKEYEFRNNYSHKNINKILTETVIPYESRYNEKFYDINDLIKRVKNYL